MHDHLPPSRATGLVVPPSAKAADDLVGNQVHNLE